MDGRKERTSMALKEVYEKQDEIPEAFRPLYTEVEGKHVFNGVEGVAGSAAQKKLREEAGGYRIKLKETATALDSWKALGESPAAVQAILDGLPELQAAAEAGGGKSAEAVRKQVEAATATITAKHARDLAAEQGKSVAALQRIEAYESRERSQAVRDAALAQTTAFKAGKFNTEAIEDVLMFAERHLEAEVERDDKGNQVIKRVKTKDNVGVTPDIEAGPWLAEIVARKTHWLAPSEGGGANGNRAGGGSGTNPWAAKTWNVTHQAAYYREHGAEKAGQMARSAGVEIGATKPKA